MPERLLASELVLTGRKTQSGTPLLASIDGAGCQALLRRNGGLIEDRAPRPRAGIASKRGASSLLHSMGWRERVGQRSRSAMGGVILELSN